MSRAVLSLGSNLGARLASLQLAVTELAAELVAVSPVYETKPWGVLDQADFLNAVIIVDSDGVNARGWLLRAQQLESQAGRVRTRHWGPRTLDVDVITVDNIRLADPDLVLPHPGAATRGTVLVPWLAIDPDAVLVGHGRIADLAAAADVSGIARRDDLVLEWR